MFCFIMLFPNWKDIEYCVLLPICEEFLEHVLPVSAFKDLIACFTIVTGLYLMDKTVTFTSF